MSSEKKALKKEEKQKRKALTCKFLEYDSCMHPTLCNRKIEFKFHLMCSSANVSELADYVDVSCSCCRKCGYAKRKDNDTETALDEELQKMEFSPAEKAQWLKSAKFEAVEQLNTQIAKAHQRMAVIETIKL